MAQIRLTADIKSDLLRKLDLFLNRSEEERNKILIFTDDPTLWTDYSEPSIRLDTLPPIPKDYEEKPGYNIVREMSVFLHQHCSWKKYGLNWCLSVRGEDNKPEVHVLFFEEILSPYDMIPIYSSDNILKSDKPREGPPFCPVSALPADVRREMWRQHHQDSTLNDVSSTIFSMSLSSEPAPPGTPGPQGQIYIYDKPERPSLDSQDTLPPESADLPDDDEQVFTFDDVPGPSSQPDPSESSAGCEAERG